MVAQKFLSAVYRTGESYGVGHLEAILTGRSDERVVRQQHDKLSVFGIISGDEAQLIKPVARSLLLKDALRTNDHGGLMFGPEAKAILKGEHSIALILPPAKERRNKRNGEANPIGDPLFEALRDKRRELAVEHGVPPYVIFHDATLREMAKLRPQTLSALGEINGVGARKLEIYGVAFLDILSA